MHAKEPDMAKKWEKEEKNEGNIGITTKKGRSIELTHRKSGKEIVVQNTPSVLKKYAKYTKNIEKAEKQLEKAVEQFELFLYRKKGLKKESSIINSTYVGYVGKFMKALEKVVRGLM